MLVVVAVVTLMVLEVVVVDILVTVPTDVDVVVLVGGRDFGMFLRGKAYVPV